MVEGRKNLTPLSLSLSLFISGNGAVSLLFLKYSKTVFCIEELPVWPLVGKISQIWLV